MDFTFAGGAQVKSRASEPLKVTFAAPGPVVRAHVHTPTRKWSGAPLSVSDLFVCCGLLLSVL